MPEEAKHSPYISPVNCVRCGKELKSISSSGADDYGMVESGVVGRLYAPFGSENDGTIFQIGICDECIKSVNLKPIGNYMDSGMDTEIRHQVKNE